MKPPSDFSGGLLSATDSEKQLIAVTLEGRTDWLPDVIRILADAQAFTDPERRLIWQTVIEMASAGKAISYDTIAAELRWNQADADPDSLVLTHSDTHAIHNGKAAIWHAQQIAIAHVRRLDAEASEIHQTADLPPTHLVAELRRKADTIEHITACAGGALPAPRPLTAQLPPVLPFNPKWLPSSLRCWISDISERMQCPPDFPAVAAISALSSVAGRRFCIQPKTLDESWFELPTLWAMLIGRPSLMKSPSMQAAMRPLRSLERQANESHESSERDRRAHQIKAAMERKAMEAQARAAVKEGAEFDFAALIADEDEATPCRRFIVNDASLEALGEVLRANPLGTLLYQDELAGLLAVLDKSGNQGFRAFLLQAWAGKEGFTFDRIARGLRRIDYAVLTVLGSIQPGVIASHIRAANSDGGGADGLMQRFSLMVWPDMPRQWRNVDRPLDQHAEAEGLEVFESIERLTPTDLIRMGATAGREGLPTFRFAPEAQECFNAWQNQFENRLRSDTIHHAVESHLAKYRKLVPALAVLTHVAEWQTGPVSLPALERALEWAGYLETHANRVYGAGNAINIEPARSLLSKLLGGEGALPDDFTARHVYRKCWSGLARPDDAEAACEMLVDHGWLIATPQAAGDRGGRPTFVYHLIPQARNKRT